MILATEPYIRAVFSKLGYEPNDAQWPVHLDHHRIKDIAGGERAGKSKTGAKEMTLWMPLTKNELFWIVAIDYEQCRQEYEYVIEDMEKLNLVKRASMAQQGGLIAELKNGNVIQTKQIADWIKFGMRAPAGLLVCETAQIPYEAWIRIRGRAIEKLAPIVMTGRFEGQLGWYPEKWNRWQIENYEDARSFSLPSWSNTKIFPQGEREITLPDGRVLQNVNEEIYGRYKELDINTFMEMYGAEPAKQSNIVLPEFSNTKHVGKYEYDPNVPVELAIDPGYGFPGAYAVEAVQVKHGDIYVVGEVYMQNKITTDIITICRNRWPWFNNITGGVVDVAGGQHHSNISVVEDWKRNEFAKLRLETPGKVNVEGGIMTLRSWLKVNPETDRPRMFFNFGCDGIIAECGGGASPVPGGGAWKRDPDTKRASDKNCHAAKALAYYIVKRFGYSASPKTESAYGKVFRRDARRGIMVPSRR